MSNLDKQSRDSKPQQKSTSSTTQPVLQRPSTAKLGENLKRSVQDHQTTDNPQKIESKKGPLSSRNSVPAKQYKYWIDVQDLVNLIRYGYEQVKGFLNEEEEKANSDNSQTIMPTNQPHQQLIKSNNINNSVQEAQNALILDQLVDNDIEIKYVLQQILSACPSCSLEDILQLSRGLKKSYLIENQKVVTQVYQTKLRSEVIQSLSDILSKLLGYQNKFKNKTLRLCFSSQQELYSIFFKIFSQELFTNITARKIFNEVWETAELFRETVCVQPAKLMNVHFHMKIELFCKGRKFYDSAKREFLLHRAVFENNLPLISRLIKCSHEGVFYTEKNELDSCGNTPLILAVKLGNVDAIKVLCDLFTCPKLKSFTQFPCGLDVASAMKNKEIIKILLEANQKIKQHYLDLHKDAIFRTLESLPDFKIDMHFNCKSNFIPFVRNITPSDTYKIYKQGSKIRLDMTLVGFRNLKCIRGNLSVLFKGRDQENEGELYVVDHDNKSVSNIFNDIAYAKIEKDLEDILSDQQYQKLYKADKFKMEPEIDKKGEIRNKQIEGFKAEKYMLKTQFTMTKFKINLQEVQTLQRFKTFEDYVTNNTFEIIPQSNSMSLSRPESSMGKKDSQSNLMISTSTVGNHKFSNNQFNATTPNPHYIRVDTDHDMVPPTTNQLFTQGNKDNNTNNTMIGYATNKKTTKKTINASIWLSKQHPLSLDSFLPLLQVLSFSSKQIAKFKDYLMKYQLPKGSFPLKAKVPLFLTMKAAFSLQNLQFDITDFSPNLFTIDEEYMKIRVQNNISYQILNQNRLLQWMNKNSPSPNSAAQTLKEIYKLCKTDEDYCEDDEDDESLERANELFNSMLKKVNQSEELLLEISSFHSEYDSVDLSERHLNDESFKLATHAFSKIQTMNSINVRHDDDDDNDVFPHQVMSGAQKQILEYQTLSNQQRKVKYGRRTSNNNSSKYILNQTNEGENIFDSKILEERPQVNYTITKRSFTKNQKPPTNGQGDTVKTLKKNFQPRNFKNYKNMIKYGCNQNQFEGTYSYSVIQPSDILGNTPQRSTADTSLVTNKLSSFFAGQTQLSRRDQGNWFKQILNYKNAITGNGGAYLHTIESEEVMGTEGQNDALSQIGNQTIAVNSSALMTQSNIEDPFSRKSFVQSFNAQSQNNQVNSSRESSLKSFNSGGPNSVQQQMQIFKNSNQSIPLKDQQSELISNQQAQNSKSQQIAQNLIKEERKALINHNTLISRFQNYVSKQQQNQHQIPISTHNVNHGTQQTPQKDRDPLSQSQSLTPQQLNVNISKSSSNNKQGPVEPQIINSATGNKQSRQNSNNNNPNKSLLPPKVAHRRQSSYGGSSSNVANYLGNIQQQQNVNNPATGSGGIFSKFFGSTFSRTSAMGQSNTNQPKTTEVNPFNAMQPQNSTLEFSKNQQNMMAFQTFDHPRQTTSRTTSNTQYGQQPPPNLLGFGQSKQQSNSAIFMKGLLSHTNKKTNDVDIFLPYQV